MLEAKAPWELSTPLGTLRFGTDPDALYALAVLADGPQAYYRFLEASGTTLTDSSGNGFNGVLSGGAGYARPTDAAIVSKTNRFLQITDTVTGGHITGSTRDSLDTILNYTKACTVECWAKPDSAGTGVGFFPFFSNMLSFYWDGAKWNLQIEAGVFGLFPQFASSAGVWTHLVVSLDADGTARAYANGVLLAASVPRDASGNPVPFSNASDWYIASLEPCTGSVDEVAIYDYALSDAQVLDHYRQGALYASSATASSPYNASMFLTVAPTRDVAVRRAVDPLPHADGAVVGDGYADAAIWLLEGELNDGAADRFQQHKQSLRGYVNRMMRSDGVLSWLPSSSTLETVRAIVRRHEKPDTSGGRAHHTPFQLSLISGDPRVYTTRERVQKLNISTGASFTSPFTSPIVGVTTSGGNTVTNTGDTDTPFILDVFGRVLGGIWILNDTTGEQIALNQGTVRVLDGQFLRIDTGTDGKTRSVLLNGTDNSYAFYNPAVSTFFKLAPGPNDLRIFVAGGDANTAAGIRFRPAWLP